MRKLFKKSLACVLAVALCLTAMVGVLTVSADTLDGTIEIADVTIEAGSTTATIPVTFTVAGDDADLINTGYINYEIDGATVTRVYDSVGNLGTNTAGSMFEIWLDETGEGGAKVANANIVVEFAAETESFTLKLSNNTSATNTEKLIDFGTAEKTFTVKAAHVHNFVPTVTKDATCEEDGVKTFACECGKDTYTEAIPAIGHKWDEGVVTTAPDCDDAGVKTYTCANDASHTKTEAIDALGHTPGEAAEENRVEAKPGVAGSYDMVVRCTVCTAELSRTTHEIPALPTGPQVDEKITITAGINVTATVNLRFLAGSIPACDDFYMEISHAQFDGDFNFAADDYVEKIYKDDLTPASGGRYYTIYTKLGVTRLNIPVTVTIHCLDENDNEIYVSNPLVTTATDEAKIGFNKNGATETVKTAYTDIINLASEAQIYFTNGKPDCDLATKIKLPNEGFVGTPTPTVPKENLAIIDETDIPEGSKITFAKPSLNMTSNPVLRFMVNGAANYGENFKVVVSYVGNDGVTRSDTWTKADMSTSGSGASIRYYKVFNNIALFDSNKAVTCTVYDGETLLGTRTYSIETAIYNITSSSPVFEEVAKLGVSARAYFGYN